MNTGTSERPDLPIALVIGGGGMGMSTARRLGQSCRVVLASLSASKNAERQQALFEDGIDAIAVQCDITDRGSVAELAKFVAGRGRLRTLAHVAGLSPSLGSWHEILNLNLVGAALMEEAMLPLAAQGTAAIFVSSLAGHRLELPTAEVTKVLDDPIAPDFFERLEALVPEHTSMRGYQLSKFALNRMCRRRAIPWGRRGARIVSMSPGLIATPMGAAEFSSANRERKIGIIRNSPAGREGTMVETADAIEFLASDRASFITGTDLLVDGGATAASFFPSE
jgi:NAD(P)-dependent dehydrogenase (short-subunit alcohol dehydrogenase family)